MSVVYSFEKQNGKSFQPRNIQKFNENAAQNDFTRPQSARYADATSSEEFCVSPRELASNQRFGRKKHDQMSGTV